MADEPQYASGADSTAVPTSKRKYDDTPAAPALTPSSGTRRPTGFSAPVVSSPPDSGHAPLSYNSVPPPPDEIQLAKQRAQEIAARLFNSTDPKRPRVENGAGFDSGPAPDQKPFLSNSQVGSLPSTIPTSYGFQGSSKTINIPNGRVGVIIGKGGDTIKYLQTQSGAKIQVTRDMDADQNSPTRPVELVGTSEQIAKAEQLIKDVLAEAESGGSSNLGSRRLTGQPGSEQFVMKIPNNKVGLIIGKGGETIKSMQQGTGARIQVIPLHLPPGDPSTERTLQIDGTTEQIDSAKQLVNEIISENRLRNSTLGGGYQQQGYQARPPANWATSAPPPLPQPGYGYVQQPGSYPGPSPQYSMSQPNYAGYPPQQQPGGYSSTGWDQSNVPSNQQTTPGSGYDYYSQQQQQGQNGPAPTDNSGYNYNQPPASSYPQAQGYPHGTSGYPVPALQPGYGQPNPVPGYDQQQGYNSAPSYGNMTNPTQDGNASSYGAQGETAQAVPPVQTSAVGQQGYSQQPNPSGYPSQAGTQQGYGALPTSQAGYGNQPGYGPGYGQPQMSPSTPGAYSHPAPGQPGYPPSQPPPAQTSYAQPDSAASRAPASGFSAAPGQPGYGAPPYGTPPPQQSYGQPPPYNSSSYGSGYSQPPVYSADGNVAPPSQATTPQGTVAKASPQGLNAGSSAN